MYNIVNNDFTNPIIYEIKFKYMYVIVKLIENYNSIKMPVILLDENHEVMEFDDEIQAEKMRKLFQENSDSGYEYIVKKL